MELQKIKFKVGMTVFAKIKGYAPWPSFILEIKNSTAKVSFFNSNQHAFVGFRKLTLISESEPILKRYLNKNKEFTKAYNELLLVVKSKQKNSHIQYASLKIRLLNSDEIAEIQKKLKMSGQSKRKLRNGRSY